MKTKHTPLAWEYDSHGVYANNRTAKNDSEFIEGNIICLAPEHAEESMKYWEANGKLIVAAPLLLEACILLKKLVSGDPTPEKVKAYELAESAINKATK